jgi:hypothetical protein
VAKDRALVKHNGHKENKHKRHDDLSHGSAKYMSHPVLRNKAGCISYMRQEDNIYNNRVYRDKCHKTSEYLLQSGRLITK